MHTFKKNKMKMKYLFIFYTDPDKRWWICSSCLAVSNALLSDVQTATPYPKQLLTPNYT